MSDRERQIEVVMAFDFEWGQRRGVARKRKQAERLLDALAAVPSEAAGGADERHREAVGKAIYEEALQQILDADPSARDAMLIAAKALGDASEYRNTGKVRWRPPEAAGVQPTEEER